MKVTLVSGQIDITKPTRLQISLFNHLCTKKYLHAMVNWLRKFGVQDIEFQISDTLQVYNYMWREKLSRQKSFAMAIQEGDKWINQNHDVIMGCFKNFNKVCVARWDIFTQHPEFHETVSRLQQLVVNDGGFRNSLDESIEIYFNKAKRTLTEERRNLSRQFFIEEIAVSEISTRHFSANEVYPGERIPAEKYLAENKSLKKEFHLSKMVFVHLSIS